MLKKFYLIVTFLLALCLISYFVFEYNLLNPDYKLIKNQEESPCEFGYDYEFDSHTNSWVCERACEIGSNLVCNSDDSCYCDHNLYVWGDPENEPRYTDEEIENILSTYNPKDANDVEKAVKAFVDKFKKDLKPGEEIWTSGMICAYGSLVCKKDSGCGCNTEIEYNNQDVLDGFNVVVNNSKFHEKKKRSYIFIHKREQIKRGG